MANIPISYVTVLFVETGSAFPLAATSISIVVVPVPLNFNVLGQAKDANPGASMYCVDVALDVVADVKVTVVVVPEGAKVFPETVNVTTREFGARRSMMFPEPEDSLFT